MSKTYTDLDVIDLHQTELCDVVLDEILWFLKERSYNEYHLVRIVEDRIRRKKNKQRDDYVKHILWLTAYDAFRKARHVKPRNRATVNDEARDLADWFVDHWHEDAGSRTMAMKDLAMASPDQRLRAAILFFREHGNEDTYDLEQEES